MENGIGVRGRIEGIDDKNDKSNKNKKQKTIKKINNKIKKEGLFSIETLRVHCIKPHHFRTVPAAGFSYAYVLHIVFIAHKIIALPSE